MVKPIARILPEPNRRQAEIDQAIAAIRARRSGTGKITAEEILAFRHKGHGY